MSRALPRFNFTLPVLQVLKDRQVVHRASPSVSAFRAAIDMIKARTNALVLMEGEKMVGIVTERDFLKLPLENGASRATPVSHIMPPAAAIKSAPASYTLERCVSTMRKAKVRHLPVVEKDVVKALISMSDICQQISNTMKTRDPLEDTTTIAALLDSPEILTPGTSVSLDLGASVADAVLDWLADNAPEIRVMGYGRLIEIFKDKGVPAEITARYGVDGMAGSHAIGHTRMATESAVTTEHSHPFIADNDVCLVHNGSLSNHNRLRAWLMRRGLHFESDNDTEVAARYFAYRLSEGASLNEAMEAGLKDLDGFYTFAMGTADGFAVLRDGFACKPAVLAETDDWVAMASEFRSLADLPGIEAASIWEPAPSIVYTWSLEDAV